MDYSLSRTEHKRLTQRERRDQVLSQETRQEHEGVHVERPYCGHHLLRSVELCFEKAHDGNDAERTHSREVAQRCCRKVK